MMEWMITISYLLTNGLRLILGLYLAANLVGAQPDKKAIVFSVLGSCLITVLDAAGLPVMGMIAAEIAVLAVITWYDLGKQLRLCLFLIFFYEVGVGLWEFLISAGMSLLFRSTKFMDPRATEYLIGIWLMRLLMMAAAALLVRQQNNGKNRAVRFASMITILGLFGVIGLSQQNIVAFSDDQLVPWIILSMVLMSAILIYRMNRQHEMEAEIAKLRQAQAEILEREYRALSKTYTDNAKLYHDLHNHIETIYQCLTQGDSVNTVGLCAVACFLPFLFGKVRGLNVLPIGLAILCLNTPICTLLSSDPDLEQAIRVLPGQAGRFCRMYCLFIFAVNGVAAVIYVCSWQLVNGGIGMADIGTAILFALQSAVLSVVLEWVSPVRNWKTESDLWHHPRKYIVPLVMLLIAVMIGTWTLAVRILSAACLAECCVLLCLD